MIGIFSAPTVRAQDYPFKSGERLEYNIYYKYGLIMARAGSASFKMDQVTYITSNSYKSELSFRTSSTFDKIFKIRDTLISYTNSNLSPIYHRKNLNEGKTRYYEEMYYKNHGRDFSKVRSLRKSGDYVKFDTILCSNGLGYDMLNIFIFARTLNYQNLYPGYTQSLVNFIGNDIVKIQLKCVGQTILEKSETEKFKTIKFEVDIIDKAFEESKNALEIWISDDKNRVPLKLKAKLKIGAGEAELSSYKGLKYPLDSRIIIPKR